MANWAALNWSESVSTGKSGARALLTMLCLKCDDDGRVFRTTPDLAKLCEMKSQRTVEGHLDYLDQLGLITLIHRIRPNASEARSVILINYPEAPHLNGAVTVLDYFTETGPRVMYPECPIRLLEREVSWSSNGAIGGVHRNHADDVQAWREQHTAEPPDPPADFAGHPPADFAGGPPQILRGTPPQILRGQGSTNQSPVGQYPTNQGRDGWLAEAKDDSEDPSAGWSLLSELGIAGKALDQWSETVTVALEVLGRQATRDQLVGGNTKPGPGAIVTTRLPALSEQVTAVQQSRAAQQQAVQEQKQQRQAKSKQAAQHNPAGSSPVGWLSDQQFASLTVLERKLVTRAAHEGVDVLDAKSRDRVTKLHRRFESDHASPDAASAGLGASQEAS